MTTKQPLEGIKVADFSWFGAGPICAENLASFGATVVRVESESHVDGIRTVAPFPPGKRLVENLAHHHGDAQALRAAQQSAQPSHFVVLT